MVLNDAGEMVMQVYPRLANKFADIECHDVIVMPNHIHFIIQNIGYNKDTNTVEADPCVCLGNEIKNTDEHIGSSLPRIIQWFKTMTTNYYIQGVKSKNWQAFDRRLWQRNYYEHIVRNHQSAIRIVQYINHNPAHWQTDSYFVN
jgi:REP element-mobilizing transposase RayT